MKKRILFAPIVSLLLCSFTSENKMMLYEFNSTETSSDKIFKYNGKVYDVGKNYELDLGRRNGPIGQSLKWNVTSYKTYTADKNGFILYYLKPMINPKAISKYTETISYTISKEFSFSFQKEETHELSLTFATGFKFENIDFSKAINQKKSVSTIDSYTYTYGESQTITRTLEYDFSRVPDNYLVSPCIVANAIQIDYKYTVYDHYWWGVYESRDPNEVNQENSLIVYDINSLEITYCIQKEGNTEKPIYYLHA